MNKLLKIVAGLLLLAVAGALLATFLFDPNDYKDEIEAQLAVATGGGLEIGGHLRFSLLPRPKLEVERVSLASAPGFGGAALAELSRVWLYPRLRPLLANQIELESVHVEGMRVHLMRDEQGRANWDFSTPLEREPAPSEASEEVQPPPPQSASGTAQVQVPLEAPVAEPAQPRGSVSPSTAEASAGARGTAIASFGADDVKVTLDDRQSGLRLVIDGAAISTGPIVAGEPVSLRFSGSVIDTQGGPSATFQAEGNLEAGSNLQVLRLEPLKLRLDGLGIGTGLIASLELQTGLEADVRARRYRADGLVLQIQTSGSALSGGQIDAKLEAGMALDLGTETLKVEGLSIHSGTLQMHGGVVGQRLLSAPMLEGDLAVEALDLRAWLAQRGLPLPRTTDEETLRRLSLRTGWRSAGGLLALQDLDLEIDQTRITGEIERTWTRPSSYNFDLEADGLDLDRYLRPGGSGPKRATPAVDVATPDLKSGSSPVEPPLEPSAKSTSAPAPADTPTLEPAPPPEPAPAASPEDPAAMLDLDGRLRVGELRLASLRFGSADLRIRAKDGIVDVNTLSEHFYQGRLTGRLGLDLRAADAKITLVQQARGIETGPFFADLTGENRVTGRGDITGDLTASGRDEEALKRSLSGSLSIQVAEGTVKGFNLERLIAEARARVGGGRPPKGLPTRTQFDEIRASAKVQKGVLDSRDLVATADHLRVTGNGTVDLVREWFDFRFEPVVLEAPQGQGLDDLEGIPIPVNLTGTFAHPQWNVDVVSALRSVAERELKGEGGLFKKLEESTGIKGLERGLRGLFGR